MTLISASRTLRKDSPAGFQPPASKNCLSVSSCPLHPYLPSPGHGYTTIQNCHVKVSTVKGVPPKTLSKFKGALIFRCPFSRGQFNDSFSFGYIYPQKIETPKFKKGQPIRYYQHIEIINIYIVRRPYRSYRFHDKECSQSYARK